MTGHIAVVCRNNLSYSRICLDTLLKQTVPCNVLIINNASSDGTAQWARQQMQNHPAVWSMSFGEVQSVSKCWNEGLKWAWSQGAFEALVVNNDTEFRPDTYELLWKHLYSDTTLGMVTGVSAGEEQDRGLIESIIESPHPDFSAYMVSRWAWEAVGGFDEAFEGAYYEDARFHVEAHRKGIRCVSIGVAFLHKRSATRRHADHGEAKRIEAAYRANKARFIALYHCDTGTREYENIFSTNAMGDTR